MNVFLEPSFFAELSHRICLTLAHSLWQVTALTALTVLIVSRLRRDKPERGYGIFVTALVLAIAVLPLTYWQFGTESTVIVPAGIHRHEIRWPAQAQNSPPSRDRYAVSPADSERVSPLAIMAGNQAATSNGFTALTPWLLGIYLLGVVVMLLRVGQGVWKTQRLATLAEPITSGPLVTTLDRLASSWSLRVIPKLAQAQNILAPQDVGLLRPTILIPTSALTGLSPDELELILTHELAHVRRHTLVGTSFQAVSLNNTEFKECDLSTVRANDLASSKFETSTPPRYDAATKFPEGFDPADHGWQLIE